MTKLIAIAAFIAPLTTACATTRQGSEGVIASRPAGITLDLHRSPDADGVRREFPAQVSVADLPSANQMRRSLIGEGHDELTAQVKLCVAPNGAVAGVSLAQSSGVPQFDAALVQDLAGWQYAAYTAPRDIRVCQPMTLTYRP